MLVASANPRSRAESLANRQAMRLVHHDLTSRLESQLQRSHLRRRRLLQLAPGLEESEALTEWNARGLRDDVRASETASDVASDEGRHGGWRQGV